MGWFSKKKVEQQSSSQPRTPDSSAPAPAGAGAPRGPADFDALVTAARAAADGNAGMDELWSAAYQLPRWNFIPRSGVDDSTPFALDVDGRGHVLAFTDEKRATDFAAMRGLKVDGDGYAVLSMELKGAVDYCAKLGAFAIHFNYGPYGFFAPLTNLHPMLSYYRPDIVHAGFNSSLRLLGLRPVRQNETVKAMLREVFRAPAWWAIESPSQKKTPHFIDLNGALVVLFFRTEAAARAAIERYGLSTPEGPAPVIMYAPAAFIGWWRAHAEQGVHYATFDVATMPFSIAIDDLPGFISDFAPR